MSDYIRRFRDTRNKCFNLTISDKDLADLAYAGLSSHIKDKLHNNGFSDASQVLQRALACESRVKDSRSFQKSSNHHAINVLEYASDDSDNEDADVYVAECSWTSKSKPFICPNLKPVQKNRQEEILLM